MTDNKCRPVSLKWRPHLTGRRLKPATHGPRTRADGCFYCTADRVVTKGDSSCPTNHVSWPFWPQRWYWPAACRRSAASPSNLPRFPTRSCNWIRRRRGVRTCASFANGINRQGQVVGLVAESPAGCLPACWTSSKIDGLQSEPYLLDSPYLPNEPTVCAAASGINESGLIVGGWDNGGGNIPLAGDALYWASWQTAPEFLPSLDVNDSRTAAFAVNNSGGACGLAALTCLCGGVRVSKSSGCIGPVRIEPSALTNIGRVFDESRRQGVWHFRDFASLMVRYGA